MMQGTLPGCPDINKLAQDKLQAEEAYLNEIIQVDLHFRVPIYFEGTLKMTRRAFEEHKAALNEDISGILDRVDCGELDFEDFLVNLKKFEISE